MKAIVNTSALRKEFERFSEIINHNTVLPILTCIKLSFDKGKVTIVATDLETTFITKTDCECKNPFTIVVDFTSIADICKKLNEPVTVEEIDKAILITGDNSKFRIPKGGKESEFPAIPDESFEFSVDIDADFFAALYNADSCKNTSDTMVTTNTACLDFKKDALSVVGTDGFVFYKRDLKVKSAKVSQSLVRGRFVKVVKGFDSGKLHIAEKFVKIETGDITVITRVQDNKYCQYEAILPKEINYNITANRVDFISAINKASTTADKATRTCALNFQEGRIKIRSQDIDFEKEGEADVSVIHTVDFDAIGVNSNQLLKILSMFDSEEVNIAAADPKKSIYLKQGDDDSVLCLLQPVALN